MVLYAIPYTMSTIIIEIEISIQTEEYPKVLSDLKIETRFSVSIFSLPASPTAAHDMQACAQHGSLFVSASLGGYRSPPIIPI
jgi:hypothetical protein